MSSISESIENTDFTSIWTWLGIIKYVIPLTLAYFTTKYLDKKLSNKVLHGQLYLVVAKSLLRAGIWIAAFFVTLSFIPSFTKTWETIFASSGIAAVVLSLAAQKTFSNMITGITISASKSRPFDIGDWIRIGDYQDGTVIDMTLRHIVIRTVNEEEIFIPNSVVDSESVINYTQGGSTMYTIEISVAYGDRVQEAMEIMADVIAGHPLYAGPVPAAVFCTECGDSGVNLTGRVVTKEFSDNYRTRSECLVMLMKRYDEAGIEIPYNKVEVLKPAAQAAPTAVETAASAGCPTEKNNSAGFGKCAETKTAASAGSTADEKNSADIGRPAEMKTAASAGYPVEAGAKHSEQASE